MCEVCNRVWAHKHCKSQLKLHSKYDIPIRVFNWFFRHFICVDLGETELFNCGCRRNQKGALKATGLIHILIVESKTSNLLIEQLMQTCYSVELLVWVVLKRKLMYGWEANVWQSTGPFFNYSSLGYFLSHFTWAIWEHWVKPPKVLLDFVSSMMALACKINSAPLFVTLAILHVHLVAYKSQDYPAKMAAISLDLVPEFFSTIKLHFAY